MRTRQSYGSVFRAEFRRVILRQKTLITLALFVVVTIAVSFGAQTAIDWAASQSDALPKDSRTFVGVPFPVGLLAFLLGIYVSSHAARDYADGSAAATIVLVPNRGRLASARMLTWIITVALTASLALAGSILVCIGHVDDLVRTAIDIACGVAGLTAYMMLAYACATVTRKGSLAVLCFFGFHMVLPSVVGILGFGPQLVVDLVSFVGKILPSSALNVVCDTSILLTSSASDYLIAAGGLFVWAIISVVLSHFALARYRGPSE